MPVTRFDVRLRRSLAGGAPFGDVGPYEELKGRLHFAVDPTHPANARITDVELAPRNAAGRVEFAADVSILLPVDRQRAAVACCSTWSIAATPWPCRTSTARPARRSSPASIPNPPIDVGDGFLMRRGFGRDLVRLAVRRAGAAGPLRLLRAPRRAAPEGKRLRGRVYTSSRPRTSADFLLSDRGHLALPGRRSRGARRGPARARPARRRGRDDPARPLALRPRGGGRVVADPRTSGSRAASRRAGSTRWPTPRSARRCSGWAWRRCATAPRGSSTGAAAEGPAAGCLRWAYAYGRSQTGRLLRTLVYYDLNLDEQGREAFDGIIANVAGGMRGEFNQRFGQNSKDRPHMMAHLFPSPTSATDPTRGRRARTPARRAREPAQGVLHEHLGRVPPRRRLAHPHRSRRHARLRPRARTRASTTSRGPSTASASGPRPIQVAPPTRRLGRASRRTSAGSWTTRRLLRACLVNLDRWVTEGVEPPPSRHPRVADGTAVPPEPLAPTFDRIPAPRYPRHHARPVASTSPRLPPRPGPAFGSLVSAVDADGNETGGIALPEVARAARPPIPAGRSAIPTSGRRAAAGLRGRHPAVPAHPARRRSLGRPRMSIEERLSFPRRLFGRVGAGVGFPPRRSSCEDIDLTVALAARAGITGPSSRRPDARSANPPGKGPDHADHAQEHAARSAGRAEAAAVTRSIPMWWRSKASA